RWSSTNSKRTLDGGVASVSEWRRTVSERVDIGSVRDAGIPALTRMSPHADLFVTGVDCAVTAALPILNRAGPHDGHRYENLQPGFRTHPTYRGAGCGVSFDLGDAA